MTHKLYREFIQKQRSCLTGEYSEWMHDVGEWRNPACHVRRAGKSGVGFKEELACIPLTHDQHAYQHQHGELACLRKFSHDAGLICRLDSAAPVEAERIAKDWFDEQVLKYRRLWQEHVGYRMKVRQ